MKSATLIESLGIVFLALTGIAYAAQGDGKGTETPKACIRSKRNFSFLDETILGAMV